MSIINDILDMEASIGLKNGKWPTLNQVFNNLRWYPLLFIFASITKVLINTRELSDQIAGYFFAIILIFLFVCVILHTAILLTAIYVGIITALVNPKFVPSRESITKNRYLQWFFFVVIVVMTTFSFQTATAIFRALVVVKQ